MTGTFLWVVTSAIRWNWIIVDNGYSWPDAMSMLMEERASQVQQTVDCALPFHPSRKSHDQRTKRQRSTYRSETRALVNSVISAGRCFVIGIVGMHGFDIELISENSQWMKWKGHSLTRTPTCLVPSSVAVAADNETSAHFELVCDRTWSNSERFYASPVQWCRRRYNPNPRLSPLAFGF